MAKMLIEKNWSNFLHVPETNPKNIANNQGDKNKQICTTQPFVLWSRGARTANVFYDNDPAGSICNILTTTGATSFHACNGAIFFHLLPRLSAQLQKMQKYYCVPPPYKH
jgi:hypothetical protein